MLIWLCHVKLLLFPKESFLSKVFRGWIFRICFFPVKSSCVTVFVSCKLYPKFFQFVFWNRFKSSTFVLSYFLCCVLSHRINIFVASFKLKVVPYVSKNDSKILTRLFEIYFDIFLYLNRRHFFSVIFKYIPVPFVWKLAIFEGVSKHFRVISSFLQTVRVYLLSNLLWLILRNWISRTDRKRRNKAKDKISFFYWLAFFDSEVIITGEEPFHLVHVSST